VRETGRVNGVAVLSRDKTDVSCRGGSKLDVFVNFRGRFKLRKNANVKKLLKLFAYS